MISYEEFKRKYLGKFIDFDSAYGFQCVDLAKAYLKDCCGFPSVGRVGDAKYMWENKYRVFGDDWKQLKGTSDLRKGDLIFTVRGRYGHVAIVESADLATVTVLEQNGGKGSETSRKERYPGNEVSVRRTPKNRYVGAWRQVRAEETYSKDPEIIRTNEVIRLYKNAAHTMEELKKLSTRTQAMEEIIEKIDIQLANAEGYLASLI